MLPSICSSLLIALAPQEAPPAASAALEELKGACEKTVAAKSYSFTTRRETSHSPAANGGGDGAGARGGLRATGGALADERPTEFKGEVQEGSPVRLTQGSFEVFRQGSSLVYRSGDGPWELTDSETLWVAPDADAESGGSVKGGSLLGGGERQDGDTGKKVSEKEILRRGLRRSLVQMNGLPIPHSCLAKAASSLSEVRREVTREGAAFVGTLTVAAAEELSGAARLREAATENQKPDRRVSVSGTMRVIVGAAGTVDRLEIETRSTGGVRGDAIRRFTITIAGLGTTKYEVPDEVLRRLGN